MLQVWQMDMAAHLVLLAPLAQFSPLPQSSCGVRPCPLAFPSSGSHLACRGEKALFCLSCVLERYMIVAVTGNKYTSGASPSYPSKMVDGRHFVFFSARL